jgi:uncharacterized membrane protein (UPF0127 family)
MTAELTGFPSLRRAVLAAACLLVSLLALLLVLASAGSAASFEEAEIVTKSGVRSFQVEIATTDEERVKGLMFRKSLPEGTGMLFDFGEERIVVMWMKNTYVPLDMIFIRADGTIARIAENTTPLSEAQISSGTPVKGVLEVVAGTARKYGIAPGDRVGHRFFSAR